MKKLQHFVDARFLDPHGVASLVSQFVLVWDCRNIDEEVAALWILAGLESTCVCVCVCVYVCVCEWDGVCVTCVCKKKKKIKEKERKEAKTTHMPYQMASHSGSSRACPHVRSAKNAPH